MALVVSFSILSVEANACGLRLEKPHAHFDGTDEQGHVLFVDTLGSLDLGNDLKLPIYAMFRSDWQGASPYLGQGWMLPLLESKIVQIDDNTFQLWQPDGWYQYMGRDSTTNTILNGQGGWKAEINGDTITAWAPCGWKLTYSSGKITSIITPKNQVLDIVYRNDKAAEIDLNGAPILVIGTDSQTGLVNSLQFNKNTITLEQADKPQIQTLNGQNVVGSVSKSLSKITFSDGKLDQFRFSVDDKVQPLLAIGDGGPNVRTFGWDPASALITKDNDWTYQITPLSTGRDSAFARKNAFGQRESWFNDPSKGQEVTEISGVKTTTSRFTSGILTGKVRKIEEAKANQTTIVYQATYDEMGRLIRVEKSPGIQLNYNEQGGLISSTRGGESQRYDEKGRLLQETLNGTSLNYSYDADGNIASISKENDAQKN